MPSIVVILGTGGTIAGRAASSHDNVGYRAGQLGVQALVDAVPALAGQALEAEQVANVDSKDMDHALWQRLAQRAAFHLARPNVAGVVVTHGTDTLEETAWFLQRVLAPEKPLVLTAAMRPATSLAADGPQNLLDAVALARTPGAQGVVLAFGGAVIAAADVRKAHPYRMQAFDAGDAGVLGWMEEGRLRALRPWPAAGAPLAQPQALRVDPAQWPVVDIVTSHAGARAAVVTALVAAGAQGLVVAGTGNATVHAALEAALAEVRAKGVAVWRRSRCAQGVVQGLLPPEGEDAAALSPVKARVELMLRLLAQR